MLSEAFFSWESILMVDGCHIYAHILPLKVNIANDRQIIGQTVLNFQLICMTKLDVSIITMLSKG